jgi:outer membrane immunogenic protein
LGIKKKGDAPVKKLLLTTVAFGVLALPAMAADMNPAPVYRAPPPVPVAVCIWCGWYVGANAGYGWSSESVSVTGSPLAINALLPGNATAAQTAAINGISGNYSPDAKGFIGGGQVGYKWQFTPSWVVGVETDIDGASIKGSAAASNFQSIAGVSGHRAQYNAQRLQQAELPRYGAR